MTVSEIRIEQASTPQRVHDARMMILAFVDWARERLADDIELVNRYFHPGLFEPELAGLPGKFAPPRGSLLVAYDGARPVGCVAFRDLGGGVCEMKRMYVADGTRGKGVGNTLVARLIEDARSSGFRVMRLDTSMHQHEAMALYEKFGFRRIGPYYDVPADLKDWLRYYELEL
ncbi:MAG: GNAT family N-acetyltransferase [Rhizobiaceae bacterium]|nr:GNAT family N-acetyltransferase [Rhizobiaceae bacterium]